MTAIRSNILCVATGEPQSSHIVSLSSKTTCGPLERSLKFVALRTLIVLNSFSGQRVSQRPQAVQSDTSNTNATLSPSLSEHSAPVGHGAAHVAQPVQACSSILICPKGENRCSKSILSTPYLRAISMTALAAAAFPNNKRLAFRETSPGIGRMEQVWWLRLDE